MHTRLFLPYMEMMMFLKTNIYFSILDNVLITDMSLLDWYVKNDDFYIKILSREKTIPD